MNYGEILGSAWKIFWKYKNLWLVWIFPYLVYSLAFILITLINQPALNMDLILQADRINQQGASFFYVIFWVVILILYLFILVYSNTANAEAVVLAERRTEPITLPGLLKSTYPHYWRVFGLYTVFQLSVFMIVIIFAGCMIAATLFTLGMATYCLFPFFLLLIPVFMVLSGLGEQSRTAIIAENLGIFEGIKRCWGIFKANFWQEILMTLILYGGAYIVMMIFAVPMYLALYFPMISSIAMNNFDLFAENIATMQLIMAIFLPIYMLIQGAVYTYVRFAWAVVFLRLSHLPDYSEINPAVNA